MPGPDRALILVADDEPSIRELIQMVLTLWGYEVRLCPDGETALARASEDGVALLLIDLRMPLMTGLEVLRQLRAAKRSLPAILMSGHIPDEIAHECGALGGIGLLPKPFTLEALRDALRGAIGPSGS